MHEPPPGARAGEPDPGARDDAMGAGACRGACCPQDECDSSSEGSYSSDGPCARRDGDPSEEEKAHFLDVCYSLVEYQRGAMHEVGRLQEWFAGLDPDDRELWASEPGPWLAEITARVEANAKFLRLFPTPDVCGVDLGPDSSVVSRVPDGHRVASRNSSKVRSTLRQFVRDWAHEGAAERAANYKPIIDALLRHLPPSGGRKPAVICPGCGLGRLVFDLALCGYAAQGNEFSYHMLLGSHLVLNQSVQAECFQIFPFVLSTANRRGRLDHLRAVRVPDVCPRVALPREAELSMVAGEFVEVYKDQVAAWDAIATCFFLDTAKNILLYVRVIAQLIRQNGFWVNLGPLLYHYADVEHETSIELSWEELRPNICRYFDIIEETRVATNYTRNPGGLMEVKYRCVLFVARRNGVPAAGHSHPVF